MYSTSLTDRLTSAYKQAFLYYIATFGYGIIAIIVLLIGFLSGGVSLFSPTSAGAGAGALLGVILIVGGFFLLFTAVFSGMIYAATNGGNPDTALGFFETYQVTLQLVLELAVAVVFAVVFLILGLFLGGGLGVLMMIVGIIALMFFPAAGLFYVINYLISRG